MRDVILAPDMRYGLRYRADHPELADYKVLSPGMHVEGMRIGDVVVLPGVHDTASGRQLSIATERNQKKSGNGNA